MLSRKYTKLIQIWKVAEAADGYGGNVINPDDGELVFTIWANPSTKNAYRTNENGQNDNFVQTVFSIRYRSDLELSIKDNFIKYKGLIYNIDSVKNLNLDDVDIEIYATQRE